MPLGKVRKSGQKGVLGSNTVLGMVAGVRWRFDFQELCFSDAVAVSSISKRALTRGRHSLVHPVHMQQRNRVGGT